LRNHVRLYLDSGATLYASLNGALFDKVKPALLYGENVDNITIEGRGTIDGQAQYEWSETKFDPRLPLHLFNHLQPDPTRLDAPKPRSCPLTE
jgi:hypothetical protein